MENQLLRQQKTDVSALEQSALAEAHRNALRRVVRCLFAEGIVARDALVFAPEGHGAWLPLWPRHVLLFFTDLRRAPADTFINRGSIMLLDASGTRIEIETAEALIELLRPSFGFEPSDSGIDALVRDMENSIDNDARARVHRDQWNAALRTKIARAGATGLFDYLRNHVGVRDAAILLDQWGSLEGHPFYPTWKSKPGLDAAEVAALSPEFHAVVNVRIAALRADSAYIERMPHVASYTAWFAEEFPQLWERWKSGLNARSLGEHAWLPLPIHSWHLEHFVRREYAAEIDEGLLIVDGPEVETWPTMSFRTMLPRLPESAPFIKLPVALWLTSEQRSLQAKSIHMGPRLSDLIGRILQAEGGFDGTLEIFPEEVALHYKHPVKQEDRPGRHLSVAYRGGRAAFERTDGLLPITVAALSTRGPVDGRPFVAELIERRGGRATAQEVQAYFREYARVVTHPVIGIYLRYGVALEAHQQNAAVLFDADGRPRRLLIRDFGDGRTFAPLLNARGYALEPYVHPGILPTVFDDDIAMVRSFVIHSCFVCHLHEVALALTDEYGLPLGQLWRVLREATAGVFEHYAQGVDATFWKTEREAFLEMPWVTRSVLRMHLQQYADYRIEHRLSNPLREAGGERVR